MYQGYSIPLESLYAAYPTCANRTSSSAPVFVIVDALLNGERLDQTASIFSLTFGPAAWVSQAIHAAAVELYLHATRKEDERLKAYSMMGRSLGLKVAIEGNEDETIERQSTIAKV